MALKLLIADPDELKLSEASQYFKDKDYQVDSAETGKKAQKIASEARFFAAVVNYRLQNHSGMQVLKFIRSKQAAKKVVFLVPSPEELAELGMSKEKMEQLGGVSVLFGEQTWESIQEEIEGYQGLSAIINQLPKRAKPGEEEEVSVIEEDFTKVKIDSFYSFNAALFDVYIRLRPGKFLKILHAGDELSQERVDRYKNDKGVNHLYFLKTDRKKYLQFLNQLGTAAVNNENLSAPSKAKMLNESTEKLLEEICQEGFKPQIVQEGFKLCKNAQKFVEKEKGLYKHMRKLEDIAPGAFSHSFLVTFLASTIARQFDWQSEKTIETISLAGMIHDIGKAKLPDLIVAARPKDLKEEELKLYMTHPALGTQMLENVPLISTSISQIVLRHHERCDGSGFPNHLTDSRLSMLSKILIVSDHFAHLILDDGMGSLEAMRHILADKDACHKFNGKVLEHFCRIFVDPEKIQKDVKVVKSKNS